MALLCGYSFPVHLILNDAGESASQVVTPRAAFDLVFGTGRVAYERGCFIIEQRKYGSPVFPGDVEASTSLDQPSPVSERTDLIPAAVAAAKAADLAVVCVGDLAGLFNTGTVGEGSDADSLDLPGVQQQLLEAVVASGTPVVVVLSSGRPYNLGGLEDKVAAFVMTFASGQEGGPALVDVLTGAVKPSGRLTISVPRNVGAVPYYYNHKMKSAGTPIARHFGSRYPFGHGLGYTTFEFRRPDD
jgi:beta-glucosidase